MTVNGLGYALKGYYTQNCFPLFSATAPLFSELFYSHICFHNCLLTDGRRRFHFAKLLHTHSAIAQF